MDKNLAGLIGAMGALTATASATPAAASSLNVEAALQAASYADLLKPIPNALALWKASVAAEPAQADEGATFQDAQYHDHDHHHHHHRRHRRVVVVRPPVVDPVAHHHHHHHHHHAAVVVVPPQN